VLVVLAVVASAVCLVLGLTVGPFVLVWVALGLGLAGLALLVLPVGRPSAPVLDLPDSGVPTSPAQGAAPEEGDRQPAVSEEADAAPASPAPVSPEPVSPEPVSPEPVSPGPGDTVLVVPGRLRFHRKACELLAAHPSEAISLTEALEEGFTPCTACIPDRSAIGAAP
jgi:hypothetical protein